MYTALPAYFKQELQNVEAIEGHTVTLHCELSKPSDPVEWKKRLAVVHPSDKYEMRQIGVNVEMLIHNVKPGDAGKYTCYSGNHQTTASLNVTGDNTTPEKHSANLFSMGKHFT